MLGYRKDVEAVVERQQDMAAEGDDHGFLLGAEHGRLGLFGSHRGIVGGLAPAPLLDGGGTDAMAQGKRPYARFTPLYGETDCLRRRGAAVENLTHNPSLAACQLSLPPHPRTEHLAVYPEAQVDVEGQCLALHPSVPAVPKIEAKRLSIA